MKNKGPVFLTVAVFLGIMASGFINGARAEGVSSGKVKIPPAINGTPVNEWRPTEEGFYVTTNHAITHFSFKSGLPEKEAGILKGMKVLEWYVGYFSSRPNLAERKVDQFLCFYLGDKEPLWMACFDYRSLGEDRDGVKGLARVVYYELFELKFFAPMVSLEDGKPI